jgi:hypothetical protein
LLKTAYLSKNAYNTIVKVTGRMPFAKPKKYACGNAGASQASKSMVSLYMDYEDEFNNHCLKRSLVESLFNVTNRVFGNNGIAGKKRMQRREQVLRIKCYKIGRVKLLNIQNSI